MVAENLLRLAGSEASVGLQILKEIILKATSAGCSSPLLEESKNLLSLFPVPAGSLFPDLYPEKIFPAIRQIFKGSGFPPDSLTSVVLDSMEVGERGSSEIEEILARALRVSLVMVIMDELRMKWSRIIQGMESEAKDREIPGVLEGLPSRPCPVIIHLAEGDLPSGSSLSRKEEELLQELRGAAPMITVKESEALPEIGRKLSERWALSVTDMKPLALISSRRVTSVLGALALGYDVVSFPPLPIHGSGRTEKFFCEDFEWRFGNAYLPSWKEDMNIKIRKHLKGLE
jgi:hypothetical protein